jgi:Stress responsive A/B Barrel Domain
MIKHIVLWRLKDLPDRSRQETAAAMKEKFESLLGVIPGLRRLEIGIDCSRSDASSDVALYSEFDSQAALAAYQEHQAHKALLPFIREAATERRLVDYEE